MDYQVFLVSEAEADILEIYKYVSRNNSINNANNIFDKLRETCYSLENLPERGHILPELERISVHKFKEIHHKPYRIIYEISDNNVYIHCILDGRRDLQELLQHRLLR